ncbi:MAG: ABC transporter substrate-binding protein [bacterium]
MNGCSRFFLCLIIALLTFAGTGCSRTPRADVSGRVEIQYWAEWTGFEGEANQALVDAFNASQDRIHVSLSTVSELDRKLLAVIAGGMPPDVATMMSHTARAYAAKSALRHLDGWLDEYGIRQENFFPILWKICRAEGHVIGLPQTPATIALHWNKRLFREAGLDPERPPQTIAELDAMAERLIKTDENGEYTQMGFLPAEPGWWNWSWGAWFGAELWDGGEKILLDSPENVAAYEWVQSFGKKYGIEKLEKFRGGFGTFDSPENPFINETLAMEIQGVWMGNFITTYNPDLEWGAAPFPVADPGLGLVSVAEANVLVIPQDSAHPDEAFEFVAFVARPENYEFLNGRQKKFSPYKQMSDGFLANHANPYIQVFIDLCNSPNTIAAPRLDLYTEVEDEMGNVFDTVWLQRMPARDALHQAQERLQKKWDRIVRTKKRAGRWHPESD